MENENGQFNNPPMFAIKFANLVFILGILYSVLIVIYGIYKIYYPIYIIDAYPLRTKIINEFNFMFIIFGGISTTLFSFGLRLRNALKINLSVLFLTVGILVYAFETYLEFNQLLYKISYDTRTAKEVLKDLNDSGIESYPNFFPKLLINSNGFKTKNGRIYPLGMISNITTILGSESGYYPIIETDEYGFNNTKIFVARRIDGNYTKSTNGY